MSTRDKGLKRHVGSSGSYNGGQRRDLAVVATSDATATVIYSIPLAEGEAVKVDFDLLGIKTDLSAALDGNGYGAFRRVSGGNVTAVGTPLVTDKREDSAGSPTFAFNANTSAQTVEIKVTGIASEDWHWECVVRYLKIA